MTSDDDSDLREFAYYYPESHWQQGRTSDWIKSILLYFDGVATLVPENNRMRAIDADPLLAGPLIDRGLLRQLEPQELITSQSVEVLASAVLNYVKEHNIQPSPDRHIGLSQISLERFGLLADPEIGTRLHDELRARGLAGDIERHSMQIDPVVRGVILCMWSQILRKPGIDLGLDLMPATDDTRFMGAFEEALNGTRKEPSAIEIVSPELEPESLNLGHVSIDEILDFRRQYGKEYQEYRQSVHKLVDDLLEFPQDRWQLLHERTAKLEDARRELDRRLILGFSLRGVVKFTLGLLSAGWLAYSRDYPAAGLAAATGFTELQRRPRNLGSFSYLFKAQEVYGR